MYNNYINVPKTALYTIANIAKKHILIATAINYQTKAKACNYIENTSFSKILFKVPTPRTSELLPSPENSGHRILLIGLSNPLFWLSRPTNPDQCQDRDTACVDPHVVEAIGGGDPGKLADLSIARLLLDCPAVVSIVLGSDQHLLVGNLAIFPGVRQDCIASRVVTRVLLENEIIGIYEPHREVAGLIDFGSWLEVRWDVVGEIRS